MSIHQIDESIDAGTIITQQEIEFDWTATGQSLYFQAIATIKDLFKQFFEDFKVSGKLRLGDSIDWKTPINYSSRINDVRNLELNQTYPLRFVLNVLRASTFEGKPATTITKNGITYEVTINIKTVNS